ncbi:hypothetical protein [Pseudodesulfovibrio senegalensis]|uniref:Uncharacterized protein n=1 Tax=Pseudodesulfovibrio senegalensis TaxID=1721087 RepID=A0A6N6N4J5_9BACT|nr:hypothetical protein [Pseudodesulfovibrio senegalensis]KAB1443082.1 hypothetical protein F8A88_02115 [Pseudodesulfovibrio senegalensis]
MENQNTGIVPDSDEQTPNQDTGNAPDSGATEDTGTEHMLPKSRFDKVNNKLKDMTTQIEGLVAVELEALPEDMRDIVPDLDPVAKLKWLQKVKAKGVFNKAPVRTSDPDSKRPDTPKNNAGASEYEKYLKSTGA